MPIYSYTCDNCKKSKDILSNVDQEKEEEDVECDGETCTCGTPMRRSWTAPNVIFKGSGFYKTGG